MSLRMMKELAGLSPWGWDSRVELHPPGPASKRDFSEVDKLALFSSGKKNNKSRRKQEGDEPDKENDILTANPNANANVSSSNNKTNDNNIMGSNNSSNINMKRTRMQYSKMDDIFSSGLQKSKSKRKQDVDASDKENLIVSASAKRTRMQYSKMEDIFPSRPQKTKPKRKEGATTAEQGCPEAKEALAGSCKTNNKPVSKPTAKLFKKKESPLFPRYQFKWSVAKWGKQPGEEQSEEAVFGDIGKSSRQKRRMSALQKACEIMSDQDKLQGWIWD